MSRVDYTFPRSWEAEILRARPAILPQRRFVYPQEAEEVERGALEVMVRPAQGAPFLATFALGFADPLAGTGLISCPDRDEMCAVSGGYAYIVDTREPERFTHLPFRPVLEVRSLREHGLLLFAGHYALLAWGEDGQAWQTGRLSAEGVRIETIRGNELQGFGWDLLTDTEVPFTVDLRTGERV